MRIVVRVQRPHQRGRQRFHQQALRHLGRNQDKNAIAAILATAIKPWDPRSAERVPHHAIEAIANSRLVAIGAALVPEPLHVNDNDGPVNGQPLILHRPSPRQNNQKRSSH
jgi:hypothetical protein